MLEKNLSKHLVEDRLDRAVYIMTNFDMGYIMRERIEKDEYNRPYKKQITSTGIMVIRNPESNMIITMYIASMHQVQKLYDYKHVPDSLYNRVKKNAKHEKFQDLVKY